MKVIVTGGAGFIGSNLAQACVEAGDEVHVVDDLSLGNPENVPAKATFHQMSILDDGLQDVMCDASVVYHLAALPSVPRSMEDPLATNLINIEGTLNVLETARRGSKPRIVFASSSSIYGDAPISPKHEALPYAPLSPYAASKAAGELYCLAYHQAFALPTVSLRFFNVYGPRQAPDGAYAPVVPRFIQSALAGQPLPIYGDGSVSRDFTYVEDVVRVMRAAAATPGAAGRILNVGKGSSTRIDELARAVVSLTGSSSTIQFHPSRRGDVKESLASTARLKAVLGMVPTTPMQEGLASTVAWMQRSRA